MGCDKYDEGKQLTGPPDFHVPETGIFAFKNTTQSGPLTTDQYRLVTHRPAPTAWTQNWIPIGQPRAPGPLALAALLPQTHHAMIQLDPIMMRPL